MGMSSEATRVDSFWACRCCRERYVDYEIGQGSNYSDRCLPCQRHELPCCGLAPESEREAETSCGPTLERCDVERVGPWQQLEEQHGWEYAIGRGAQGEAWLVNRDPSGEIHGLCGDPGKALGVEELLGLRSDWQAIELTENEQADDWATLRRAVDVLDRLLGDTDVDGDTSPEMRACQALSELLAKREADPEMAAWPQTMRQLADEGPPGIEAARIGVTCSRCEQPLGSLCDRCRGER
jgi:hypothetical protein